MKKCDHESVHRRTDTPHTRTHAQTQNDFIICPMLYAIAMRQITIAVLCRFKTGKIDSISRFRAQRIGASSLELPWKIVNLSAISQAQVAQISHLTVLFST